MLLLAIEGPYSTVSTLSTTRLRYSHNQFKLNALCVCFTLEANTCKHMHAVAYVGRGHLEMPPFCLNMKIFERKIVHLNQKYHHSATNLMPLALALSQNPKYAIPCTHTHTHTQPFYSSLDWGHKF